MTSHASGNSGRVAAVRPEPLDHSKQGVPYFVGISAESVGSRALCAHLVEIPPGGRAKAHLHEAHESAIYLLEGTVTTWHGEGLRDSTTNTQGEFLYIPAGVPHMPVNASKTDRAFAVLARTDPNEQESVVLLPELDDLPHTL